MGGYGLDSFGSRQGQVVSSCEYGNESPGFFISQRTTSFSRKTLFH
jgi:hypothetical protein